VPGCIPVEPSDQVGCEVREHCPPSVLSGAVTAAEPTCGDCAYLDGACRCRHGEPAPTRFTIPWPNDIVPPF
jgi:hypothetical protein